MGRSPSEPCGLSMLLSSLQYLLALEFLRNDRCLGRWEEQGFRAALDCFVGSMLRAIAAKRPCAARNLASIVRHRTYSTERLAHHFPRNWPCVATCASGRNKTRQNAPSDQGGVGFLVVATYEGQATTEEEAGDSVTSRAACSRYPITGKPMILY